jgi:hypothetical protein
LPAFERAVSAPRILGQSAAWTHPEAAALAGAASLKDCIVLVPAFALKNQDHLGRLIAEKLKPLFKKGETLCAASELDTFLEIWSANVDGKRCPLDC